jgi:release factor glutamine methyltransferase
LIIKDAYTFSKSQLRAIYPADEADAIVDYLFEEAFGIDKKGRLLTSDKVFEHEETLRGYLNRLMSGEPVQHILHYAYFGGARIRVNQSVLIPRPETEELLEWAIGQTKTNPAVIADICTGSGCIALYMRSKFPSTAIIGSDISTEALQTALLSEKDIFRSETVTWLQHDILKTEWTNQWPDIVICNPPYIGKEEAELMTQNVLNFEPHLALFVEDEDTLLFYKKVIEVFSQGKFPVVYFELNPLTAEDLQKYCIEGGYQMLTGKDMQGKIRFARITR